jgi:hypothetical protein
MQRAIETASPLGGTAASLARDYFYFWRFS